MSQPKIEILTVHPITDSMIEAIKSWVDGYDCLSISLNDKPLISVPAVKITYSIRIPKVNDILRFSVSVTKVFLDDIPPNTVFKGMIVESIEDSVKKHPRYSE